MNWIWSIIKLIDEVHVRSYTYMYMHGVAGLDSSRIYQSLKFFIADLQQLINQAKQSPYQGGALTLSHLEPSDTILVTNITDSASDTLLHYYFDSKDDQNGTVTAVKRLSPTRALVTFMSHDSKHYK